MVWPDWPTWMAAAGINDFDDSHCMAFSDSSHVVQAVIDNDVVGLVEPEGTIPHQFAYTTESKFQSGVM
jgi:hypothetical protein